MPSVLLLNGGSLVDATGRHTINTNDGTVTSSGGMLSFDGGSALRIDDNLSDFDFGTGSFTIEGELNAPTAGAATAILVSTYDGTDGSWEVFTRGPSNYNGGIYVTAGVYTEPVGGGVSEWVSGTTKHFALVYDAVAETFSVFLDGRRVDIIAGPQTFANASPGSLFIGRENAGSTKFYKGLLRLHINKGEALYSGTTYTPPTWPISATGAAFVATQTAQPTTQTATMTTRAAVTANQTAQATSQTAAMSASLINMQFDAGNGSTTFTDTDTGTGTRTWTGSGGAVCTTATVLNGASSLSLPSTAAYLQSSATTAQSRLPATGNFEVSWVMQASGWGDAEILSIQDAGKTAAGTQFAVRTQGGQLQLVLSDGTTRAVIATSAAVLATNTPIACRLYRDNSNTSNNLFLEVNGANQIIADFKKSFPSVATPWRIGANAAGDAGPTGFVFDKFQVNAAVALQPGGYVINMQFDTGNGSTNFIDGGSAASVWSIGAGSGAVACGISPIMDGDSSLSIPSGGLSFLTTPNTPANRLPATDDWVIKFIARASSWARPAGGGCYILSIQDAGATGAGTQFAIATNSSGQAQVVVSDGTTRSVLFTTAAGVTTSANVRFELRRVNNTITLYLDDVVVGQGTFTGAFPPAASTPWRIGSEGTVASGPTNGMYFDKFTVYTGAALQSNFVAGDGDPYFYDTPILLHMDGANGSTAVRDESGKAWATSGPSAISTAQSVYGGASGLFNGAGGFYTPGVASMDFGLADLTIECWIRPASATDGDFIAHRNSASNTTFWFVRRNAAGAIRFVNKVGNVNVVDITSTVTVALNTWAHVAITKIKGVYRIWINGVPDTSATYTGVTAWINPYPLWVGMGDDSGASGFIGYIDEVRITRGRSRYTAAFTPAGPFRGPIGRTEAPTTQVATMTTVQPSFAAAQTAAPTTQVATLAARATIAAAQTAEATTQVATMVQVVVSTLTAAQTAEPTTQAATLAALATMSAAQTAEATTQDATLARPGAATISASQTADATTQAATLVSRMVMQAAQTAEATSQAAMLSVRAVLQAAQTAADTTQAATLARPALGLSAAQVADPTTQEASLEAPATVSAQQLAQATAQVAALVALATLAANQAAEATTQAAHFTLNFDFERTQRTLVLGAEDRVLILGAEDRHLPLGAEDRVLVLGAEDRTLYLSGDPK